MKGKIIKGIAGFYYVHGEDERLYTCKAKGIFRNDNIKPLVGDNVIIEISDKNLLEGIIAKILPRKNELIRPAVANIDKALVIFAAAEPEPNLNLLDKFLVYMEMQDIDTIICFNKSDIVDEDKIKLIDEIYSLAGYKTIHSSVKFNTNILEIKSLLKGNTTVLAGPSGVGKSSLVNLLCPHVSMEVGEVSDKIKRGKHTTRHSELVSLNDNTYILDTPGFSSLTLDDIEKDELKKYFREFSDYVEKCKFLTCSHINEPDCGVKNALNESLINKSRYNNYLYLYDELNKIKRY